MFKLGKVVGTPGALETLENERVSVTELLEMHRALKPGMLPDEDVIANRRALIDGDRIFSAYAVGAEKVWIITEWDRSVTTLLLPAEY